MNFRKKKKNKKKKKNIKKNQKSKHPPKFPKPLKKTKKPTLNSNYFIRAYFPKRHSPNIRATFQKPSPSKTSKIKKKNPKINQILTG